MKNLVRILMISFVIVISGCSTQAELNLDDSMAAVIEYKLYEVETEISDKVNQWLTNARLTGEEGQYFILQDGTAGASYMYSYVYRKGYSDYEVSFIYDPSDSSSRGKIHIAGIKNNPTNEKIVEIKSINDLSILIILSDESLKNKLN